MDEASAAVRVEVPVANPAVGRPRLELQAVAGLDQHVACSEGGRTGRGVADDALVLVELVLLAVGDGLWRALAVQRVVALPAHLAGAAERADDFALWVGQEAHALVVDQ